MQNLQGFMQEQGYKTALVGGEIEVGRRFERAPLGLLFSTLPYIIRAKRKGGIPCDVSIFNAGRWHRNRPL